MKRLLFFDAGAPLLLFPWTVSVLLLDNRDVKYMSVMYGILVSLVIAGRYAGPYYTFEKKGEQGVKMPVARMQCLILFIAFFILTISNRIFLVFLCYFAIGFASSSLGTLVRNHKNYLRKRYRQNSSAPSINSEILRVNIMSVVALPLLAGVLFDSSVDSALPMFWPCALVTLYFAVLLLQNSLYAWYPILSGLARGRVMEAVDGSNAESNLLLPVQALDICIDESSVVPNDLYVRAFNSDVAAAKLAYITRLKWRKMYDVENILSTPQQFFDEILENYPHAIHGRSKEGCAIVYELIGQGNPKRIIELGITPDLLVWHFNLRNEYIFRKLSKTTSGPINSDLDVDPSEAITHLMTVIDVKGVGISDFTADVLSFMKKSGDTIETYYPPKTVIRLVIVNTPYWFSSVWAMIAKVLPEAITKKVVFCRTVSELDQFVDPNQRPIEYGGTDPNPLGKSADHLGFLEIAKKWEVSSGDIESAAEIGRTPAAAIYESKSTAPIAISIEKASSSDSPITSPVASSDGWFSRFGIKKPQKEAYLGKSNSFRYDKSTQSWVLDQDVDPKLSFQSKSAGNASFAGQNVSSTVVPKSSQQEVLSTDWTTSPDSFRTRRDTRAGSLDQLEEHGLILAIQAAHKARTGGQAADVEDSVFQVEALLSRELLQKEDISSSLEQGTASVVGKIQGLGVYHRKDSSQQDDSSDRGSDHGGHEGLNGKNGNVSNNATSVMRISGPLFLYVFSAHAVACFCQSSSVWLLPLWVYAPANYGGLSYSVLDFSMVISTSGLMLWVIHMYGDDRLQLVVSSSPARAIRIGCGSMAFSIFFLPTLARATIFSTPAGAGANNSTITGMFLSAQPSSTPTALLLPSFLIALLIAGSYITRIATRTILSTSLRNSFAMPDTVITALSGVMDVAGPSVGGVIFSLFYRDTLFRLPLQSFVVLYGVIIILAVLYSSTLLLNVHFRGDFGIVTERVVDLQDSRRSRCLQCVNGDTYVPVRGREGDGTYYVLKGYIVALLQAAVNCVLDVIAVPHGDLQFLVSPMQAVASHGGHIAGDVRSSVNYKNI